MATNVQVIGDALRELNVISEIESPSAEQGQHGLRKLNELLEAWTESGINLGYFQQTSTTADCPIPHWAERGVKAALAIEVAATYGATVSQELASKYTEGYGMILRKSMVESMTEADLSDMPRGSGNYGSGFDIING